MDMSFTKTTMEVFHAVQNDTRRTIEIKAEGIPNNATVSVVFLLPDGSYQSAAGTLTNGVISADVPASALAVPGTGLVYGRAVVGTQKVMTIPAKFVIDRRIQ